MLQGEVREVGIEVIKQEGNDFEISAADYQITKYDGTTIEAGQPVINDHKLIVLFSANDIGKFYVIFKYHVGPEILKAKILVEVS